MRGVESIRSRLGRRKRKRQAVLLAMVLFTLATVGPLGAHPYAPILWLGSLFGLGIPLLVLELGARCPTCAGPWRRLIRLGPMWGIDPDLRLCPWCGTDLDTGLPRGEARLEAPTELSEHAAWRGRLAAALLPLAPGVPVRDALSRRGRRFLLLGSMAALLLAGAGIALSRSGANPFLTLLLFLQAFVALPAALGLFRASLSCPTCRRPWSALLGVPWRLSPLLRWCPWCGEDVDGEPAEL